MTATKATTTHECQRCYSPLDRDDVIVKRVKYTDLTNRSQKASRSRGWMCQACMEQDADFVKKPLNRWSFPRFQHRTGATYLGPRTFYSAGGDNDALHVTDLSGMLGVPEVELTYEERDPNSGQVLMQGAVRLEAHQLEELQEYIASVLR